MVCKVINPLGFGLIVNGLIFFAVPFDIRKSSSNPFQPL